MDFFQQFLGLAKTLLFLHQQGYSDLSIRPENIFVFFSPPEEKSIRLKFFDFYQKENTSYAGTFYEINVYLSPEELSLENLNPNPNDREKMDVYSFGVTMGVVFLAWKQKTYLQNHWKLASKKSTFSYNVMNKNLRPINFGCKNICKNENTHEEPTEEVKMFGLFDFLSACWEKDVQKRIGVYKVIEMLEKMVESATI